MPGAFSPPVTVVKLVKLFNYTLKHKVTNNFYQIKVEKHEPMYRKKL
jgi:hypothetical protein